MQHPASDAIVINGLEFYAYHGASDPEQVVGHRYHVDMRLYCDTTLPGATDRLPDTVSYSRVARRVVEIGTERQFRLLEALAAEITRSVLDEFPIDSVWIRLVKTLPPMNAIVASVGVEIHRHRLQPAASAS